MKKSKLHLLRKHFEIYKDKAGKDIRENSAQRADQCDSIVNWLRFYWERFLELESLSHKTVTT